MSRKVSPSDGVVAPEFSMEKKYKCGREFCKKFFETQNLILEWWFWDDLGLDELKEKFDTKSRYSKYGHIACFSCQKNEGVKGHRVFKYETGVDSRSYSKRLYGNIKRGSECQEKGVGRIKEYEGERYILFNKIYDNDKEYEQESHKILKKYYPYGGKFYIVNERSMQLQCINMSYKDYLVKEDGSRTFDSVSGEDVGKALFAPEEYETKMYKYYYVVK